MVGESDTYGMLDTLDVKKKQKKKTLNETMKFLSRG